MKYIITLRSLVSLSFLLFFLPFLRTCSEKSIENLHSEEVTAVLIVDSANKVIEGNDTIRTFKAPSKQKETKFLQQEKENRIVRINNAKREFTFNFYTLLVKTLFTDKLHKSSFFESSFYYLSGYFLVLISTIIMWISSFLNKIKTVQILSSINLILLSSSTILLYFCEALEELDQIKIGYYLIFINFILIIIFSRKILKDNQTV
ncbi:hypothetical protein LUD75_13930 [Epilithonimonas sp. JDS]|uniref:hypothetical protein n=1 Tax=Epilithonimonas sp. JDS TaxID=2902797 RepID=UPI001E65523F|nr:hypothetical protein [Epilithonimonas sp. JDS]MCD9855819.1 hypothetical protein [Epilithonimonas sp. JDS]